MTTFTRCTVCMEEQGCHLRTGLQKTYPFRSSPLALVHTGLREWSRASSAELARFHSRRQSRFRPRFKRHLCRFLHRCLCKSRPEIAKSSTRTTFWNRCSAANAASHRLGRRHCRQLEAFEMRFHMWNRISNRMKSHPVWTWAEQRMNWERTRTLQRF